MVSTVLGVLEIKSESGTLRGIGVPGLLVATGGTASCSELTIFAVVG